MSLGEANDETNLGHDAGSRESFDDRLRSSLRREPGSDRADVDDRNAAATALAAELPDRFAERERDYVNDAPARPSVSSGRVRQKSGSGLALFVIVGIIALLAFYILVVDNDGSSDAGEDAETEEVSGRTTPIPEPTRRSTGPINFFNHLIPHYDNHVAGSLSVGIEESNLAALQQKMSDEGVRDLAFTGASQPLIGGIVQEVRERQVGTYVYGDDDTKLVVTEIPWSSLVAEEVFYVAADVRSKLEAGEVVSSPTASGRGTIAMYRDGEIVVVAAADRSRPDLLRIVGQN